MKKTTQLLLVLLLAGVTGSSAMAQGDQTSPARNTEKITFEMLISKHNFPVKQNTGNPELDHQKYTAAKREWISKNQELYKRYNSQGVQGNPSQRKSSSSVLTPSN